MAFITADRVLDSSTSTGTGAFVVSGTPAAGYRTFSAVMSVSDTCYYSIQGQTTSEWEVGLGTYSSANTLTRTTVYSSSNSGSAVTFSAGTKNVFITMAAARSPQLDPSGNMTALGTPASIALTNATNLPLATGVTGTLSANNGGSVAWQSVQTTGFTAVAGNAYPVNTTSGAITVTLPASPSAGNIVQLTDYAGTWATNNVTVGRNSSNINGSATDVVLGIRRESIAFVYIDATQGWLAYVGINTTNVYGASYLVVAGGGGGGAGTAPAASGSGGGGGAGGLFSGTTALVIGTTYTITVGAGGAASASGTNSTFAGSTAAVGGGYGSTANSLTVPNPAGTGGSGGGGSGYSVAGSSNGASGTSGQGYAGGNGVGSDTSADAISGGGGGGSSAIGANSTGTSGGSGGSGTVSSITGSSITYAGGGGGGKRTNVGGTGGAGGTGGGGAGSSTGIGTAGTANTGGGGGGGAGASIGGAGGSGVVILSVPTAFYSGTTTGSPTVTTSNGNTIIKFTASGSYTA